jgi:LEA14-like dessication related protein
MVLSLFTACTGIKQSIADNVSYEIVDIDIDAMSNIQSTIGNLFGGNIAKASEGKLKVNLQITNNNNLDLTTKELKYNVFINDLYVGKGSLHKNITIKNNQKSNIQLPLKVNMKVMLENGINLTTLSNIHIKVKGNAIYSGIFGEEHVVFTIENGKLTIN